MKILNEDNPLIVKEDGIVVKTKIMEIDKIYYCVYRNRTFLFFKDENELVNCYEVEDKEVAEAIRLDPDSDSIKNILGKYLDKRQMENDV